MLKNKKILITGGTGSFGNMVVKKLFKTDVEEIRVLSRDENKQEQMRLKYNDKRLKTFIGDVKDKDSLFDVTKNIDFVFHAAALKQVPSCEFYPIEAIKTNIIGSENVIDMSIKNKVKKVVLLSTDKAVSPVNAMGLTKALMEKIMVAKARLLDVNSTKLCATRYGNVLGSRGSVVPLFISQIKAGEPITITDPKMTRFLMTLEKSVDLVFHAFENGNQGDIFVQKSPASNLKDLGNAVLKIFKPEKHFVKNIGIRHGEKMFETLLSSEEMSKAVESENYFQIPMDNRNLNYNNYFIEGEIGREKFQEYNSKNTTMLNVNQIIDLLITQDFIKDSL